MSENNLPQVYIQKQCPLCNSINLKPVKTEMNVFKDAISPIVRQFDGTWVQLMECNQCGFAFAKEIPVDPAFFENRYDIRFDPEFESRNPMKDKILEDIFSMLKRHGKQSGLLLDVGSFAGIAMRVAEKKGFEVEGVEVNPTMATYCKENLKLKVFNGKFADFPCDGEKYDVIIMIDVLEHLFQPRPIIEKCHSILKKGGIFLVKVPSYKPQKFKQNIANFLKISKKGIFANFGHINLFSPKSLTYVLNEIGFDYLECQVADLEIFGDKSFKSMIKNINRKLTYWLLNTINRLTGLHVGLSFIYLARKR